MNPFSITRAVEFTDSEILNQWVPVPGEGGLEGLVKPASRMPMIILGGKGSGKTHAMRYLTESRRITQKDRVEFLGVYVRCRGINSSRFHGKGIDEIVWDDVFSYYFDLILAEACLSAAIQAAKSASFLVDEQYTVECVLSLFDEPPALSEYSFEVLISHLANLRREVDIAVNNCGITRELHVRIRATPGRLVYGLPGVFAQFSEFKGCVFAYLLDELENFGERQQIYVNTLIRYNEPPCTFRVGARLYGLRTAMTRSSEEELKEGSEYELLPLDERFRTMKESEYIEFVARMVVKRLAVAGFHTVAPKDPVSWCRTAFEERDDTDILRAVSKGRRPWRRRFEQNLREALRRSLLAAKPSDISQILNLVYSNANPILERVNIHAVYQRWGDQSLLSACRDIYEMSRAFQSGHDCGWYLDFHKHWNKDLAAQIRRDLNLSQNYTGFDTLVRVSHGLPRHLLIVLRHAYDWAVFQGEEPFKGRPLSAAAQERGIVDAAHWFLRDARTAGQDGVGARRFALRVAQLLKAIRFSDKPSEVSLTTISFDEERLSKEAASVVSTAVNWSLFSEVARRKDRNSYRSDYAIQLNPLLCPIWDLPIVRRGILSLPSSGMEVIALGTDEDFKTYERERTRMMNGPAFSQSAPAAQKSLFDGEP